MSHPPPLRAWAAAMLACLATSAVQAQVAAAFQGPWKAGWQTDAKAYEARFTVTESGGSWQTATRGPGNPCAGRDVPLRVDSASPTEVQFTLMFSDVIAGCQNVKLVLRLGADGSITGTRSRYELTLSR